MQNESKAHFQGFLQEVSQQVISQSPDGDDCPLQQAFQQEIQQEIQQDLPSLVYCLFICVCHMITTDSGFYVVVPVHTYRDWCSEITRLGKKYHKFKAVLRNKSGVKSSIRCSGGVGFVERKSGNFIIPDVLSRVDPAFRVPVSKVGRENISIASRSDLNDEEKVALLEGVFDRVIEGNQTGNHYRNNYVRARNPYGHE